MSLESRRNKDARMLAHQCFDRLWKEGHHSSRTESYRWLAARLKLKKHDCHIAQFDAKMCMKVIQLSNEYIKESKKK